VENVTIAKSSKNMEVVKAGFAENENVMKMYFLEILQAKIFLGIP